jgi:DNA-binding transcriptional MocR family regulator
MISPYPFKPRGRLLDVMRQVGDPGLINLAAGLPSVHCVPKADLTDAFAATLEENADEALGYHVPDGDPRLRQLLVDRFHRRGINTSVDQMVITTGCSQVRSQKWVTLLCQKWVTPLWGKIHGVCQKRVTDFGG